MSRAAVALLDPISAAWLDWCVAEGVPANTVRRRRAVLRSVGNAGTATREEIEAWWTTRRHLAPSTRANDLANLRSFYTWCQIWEHRSDNPTVRLRPPSAGAGAPKPFTRAELDRILTHLDTLHPDDRGPLRRATLLGAWAGLRISEAASLGWRHVDTDSRSALVLGKGQKTRRVPLATALLEELGEPMPSVRANVVTRTDVEWTPGTLGRKINAAIAAAGVEGTFHKLRHRYGSVAYQRTKDPKALAEVMGHASVSTTMTFYAAAADDAAQMIADAVVDD